MEDLITPNPSQFIEIIGGSIYEDKNDAIKSLIDNAVSDLFSLLKKN